LLQTGRLGHQEEDNISSVGLSAVTSITAKGKSVRTTKGASKTQ